MAPTFPIDFTGQRKSIEYSISKTGSGDMKSKARKVSKGYSTGFVPGYRHAVETVAESEGFGTSGHGVAELTTSVDLKKECVNLSVDKDIFNVPMQNLSLSKMSRIEKRGLIMSLKNELERVRMLQRKITSLTSEAMAPPPTSKTHPYQNGSKGSGMVGSSPTSMNDVSVVPGRKKFPPGRNGPRIKGGDVAAKTEEVKQGLPQSNNLAMLMKQCETLLCRLMSHQHAWIFNEPVDIVKHNIPDYFKVIKHPMDLGTIKRKLFSGHYSSPAEYAADVRLTFKNALTYNPVGHDVHVMAGVMSKYFEMRWKPIEKKIPATYESTALKSSAKIQPESTYVPPTKKQKTTPVESKANHEIHKRRMSDFEKQKLSAELEDSMAELPDNIIDFLKESTLNGSQVCEDEIEIDIDTLNDDILYKLRKLMDDYLLKKQTNQVKLEPLDTEIHNKSRFSNVSAVDYEDHDSADEDVDIGEDDPPPVSSTIMVEIRNDATLRDNNCSSSSSSGSESGSSSSDSHSGRSADELDTARTSILANTISEAGHREEHRECDGGDANSVDFSNEHDEKSAPSKSSVMEPSCRQEGENEPPDRQVSPEKLYRAALLRSRFADIIIKAQENTIEKGEKPDPEKLKFEKEEIERRRREEKARLQAEAKAAEEARRKIEEKAAAEAKRQRELEREAARQALLKMEKTVDINENSQFMEDLEMFKAAPDENLNQEGSPESCLNALGSFKFPASSNPLEQLGLYMKNEEDDDEELEHQSIQDTSNNDLGDSD